MIDAMDLVTETLLPRYQKRSTHHRPFIVGIDGLGGAGKTTFAKALKNKLKQKTTILHLDDYIVEKRRRYGTGEEEWYEYYALQWDIGTLQSSLFQKLHHTLDVTLPFYDSFSDMIIKKDFIYDQNTIVLIEGVFLQRKEWRDFFDYVIFLDCTHEQRTERVIGRDLYLGDEKERVAKYERRYWKAEDHYLLHDDPIGRADHIVKVP
ncbi:AAA family ATPase [Rossellomorea aquimaris]|uniref:kinase n=2 Tax=Rossellomorea TaxID=2837508 RepID=UPI001CD6AE96|nr:kinase [Rossellomorea aquimaris]MCA1060496.1 AAA family ATPase [Rossellomorea aquimaris]